VIDAGETSSPDKSGGVYGICLRGKRGWGRRNMAFPDRDVELVRRALVRREMAAAISNQAGMERRPLHGPIVDLMEGRRPSRRQLERFQ